MAQKKYSSSRQSCSRAVGSRAKLSQTQENVFLGKPRTIAFFLELYKPNKQNVYDIYEIN